MSGSIAAKFDRVCGQCILNSAVGTLQTAQHKSPSQQFTVFYFTDSVILKGNIACSANSTCEHVCPRVEMCVEMCRFVLLKDKEKEKEMMEWSNQPRC